MGPLLDSRVDQYSDYEDKNNKSRLEAVCRMHPLSGINRNHFESWAEDDGDKENETWEEYPIWDGDDIEDDSSNEVDWDGQDTAAPMEEV